MRTSLQKTRDRVYSLATQATRRIAACYNHELAPLGLTAQQVTALAVLWKEENLSLGVFAKRAGIGKAAAVAMIRRLEAMGLVISGPHPADGRKNVIRLTQKALELAPEVASRINSLENSIESQIGGSNIHALMETLKKIRDLKI